MKTLRKEDYTVGWICALPFPEWKASRLLLDEVHHDLSLGPGVKNQYVYGSMNGHNVVMGCLPSSQMGRGAAASVASEMGVIFPFLRFGLLVGIGGGVPSETKDIRLGDVIVSQPDQVEHHGGVIQYDYGKTVQEGTTLQDTGLLNQPPYILLSALSKIQSAPRSSSKFGEYIDCLQHNEDDPDFRDPPRLDRLFEASYVHVPGASSCDPCSAEHEVKRPPRRNPGPVAHYGTIASGDQVMKSAPIRDALSKKHNGILCFEMEAAGLMNQFPCLVIRGICDYCDSHKNKKWQPFAAAVAAAWGKELLRNVACAEPSVDGMSTAPLEIQRELAQMSIQGQDHHRTGDSKKRREQVKAYLGPTSHAQDVLDRVTKQRAPGTGEWIRYDQNFTAWLNRAFPVLWVSGTSGAGKTFLSASMASYLEQTLSRNAPDGAKSSLGYYFFNDNNPNTQDICQALRDAAFQICQSNTSYEMYLEDLSTSAVDIKSLAGAWKHLFRDFWIRGPNNMSDMDSVAYIVLDALDEAFVKEFKDFLGLLQDINFNAALPSRLQIVLVGRTHLTDDVSDALPMGQFHDIAVDPGKTAADIQTYIKGSMRKSRLLRKVSKKLQDEVLSVLSEQSSGMFLWVDLMLRELNTKRSERGVSEALHQAPKGIFPILRHVLEGLSGSLPQEDADDFNDLLQWVASAPEPLTLGILDAMLKYRSPTGDSVVLLESRLRRQYASFFSVLRIDGLTTAELQRADKPDFDYEQEDDDDDDRDDEQVLASPGDEMGFDDLDPDFDSDLNSTYVVFTHASIGDFFGEEGGAKVRSLNGPTIGIEIESSRLQVLKLLLEVLMDNGLSSDEIEKMDEEAAESAKGMLALKKYSRPGLLKHLPTVNPSKVSIDEKKAFVPVLAKFFREKDCFADWVKAIDVLDAFWAGPTIPLVRKWLEDPDVQDALSEEDREWVKSTSDKPFTTLGSIALYHAERWLLDTWSVPTVDYRFIHKYLQMLDPAQKDSKEEQAKEGASEESASQEEKHKKEEPEAKNSAEIQTASGDEEDEADEEDVTVQSIIEAAKWAGFEETALWHRRVAMVIRDEGFHDESKAHFQRAIDLDPDMLEARGGLARVHMIQKEYEKGMELLEETSGLLKAKLEAAKLANAPEASIKQTAHWLALDLTNVGNCYEALGRIDEACQAFRQAWDMEPSYTQSALEFIRLKDSHDRCQDCVDFVREMDQRKVEGGDCSYLTQLLSFQLQSAASVLSVMNRAFMQTGEINFLDGLLRHAITHSRKNKRLDNAMLLELLLGILYCWLPDKEDRAAKILERYASMKTAETHPSVAMMHEIGMAALASFYFDQAWNAYGTPECRIYLQKLEKLAAPDSQATSLEYGSTPGVVLGSWLRSHGQPGEAVTQFRPRIAHALQEISDDTPSDSMSELGILGSMLILAGDEPNTAAIFRTLLNVKDVTKAVIEDALDCCEGFCSTQASMWFTEAMYVCKNCHGTKLCEKCLKKLRDGSAGEMFKRVCSPQHDWLRIEVRKETVPDGKILVGSSDELMDFKVWKQELKKSWHIK